MPLFLTKTEDNFRIEIRKIEEDLDELLSKSVLSPFDLKILESFKSDHRKKEWLCVRMMLQDMMNTSPAPAIIYDDQGKPHLENSQTKISISHTKDFVGVMISENNHVGIDLERSRPQIERIIHKFLSVDEKTRIPETNQLHYYLILWSTKEVLYKIHGKEGLLFDKEILTDPFEVKEKGSLSASICLTGFPQHPFQVHYEFIGDLLLTYSIS